MRGAAGGCSGATGKRQDPAVAGKTAAQACAPPVCGGGSGLVAAFAFFLAGAAQAYARQGLKAFLGDGVAAVAAAGHAVDDAGPPRSMAAGRA